MPDSERAASAVSEVELSLRGRQFDWFSLAPKILGAVLALLLIITFVFIFLPNLKREKQRSQLSQEWKKLEPDYNVFVEKEKEEQKYMNVLNEFYRFIDEKVIWSRHLHIIAKNIPKEIKLLKLSARDELKNYDAIERVQVEDEKGKITTVERIVPKKKLVHTIGMDGLAPVDGQAKVVMFERNLKKDDFLKDVIVDSKQLGITATSRTFLSFSMEIQLDSKKASRE
ncbi:MAG: hypothetical protein JW928_06875 [Candidatus Aureabacteria bacterium]|nr:hypothetical protein [Candidatus Auribacterota bacterium]